MRGGKLQDRKEQHAEPAEPGEIDATAPFESELISRWLLIIRNCDGSVKRGRSDVQKRAKTEDDWWPTHERFFRVLAILHDKNRARKSRNRAHEIHEPNDDAKYFLQNNNFLVIFKQLVGHFIFAKNSWE